LRLLELTSRDFRNLSSDVVSFGPGVNLVSGENGQGKTNLLEAVALLTGQRSFRRAKPTEMASDGRRFAVEGSVRRGFTTEELSVDWSAGVGRRFLRSGKEISFREASALAPAVFLAPEHRSIVTGPPEERRRFVDRLILGVRPAAWGHLAAYERALRERNALLARIASRRNHAPYTRPLPSEEGVGELDAWTEEVASAGEAVRRHRREVLAVWREAFSGLLERAGAEYSDISLSYSCGEGSDLRATLKNLLPIERARGRSLAGPHRDDLVWNRGSQPLEGRASAGEIHRLATLAKLSEWQVVKDAAGEPPLFGVDDFDAGLSTKSLESFLAAIPDGTTVILTTASDPARFRGLAATVLQMSAGRCIGDGVRAVAGV
jgi:DNA replication and repair protein RecF